MKTRKETIETCKAIRASLKEMTKIFNCANEAKFRQCRTLADKFIENSEGDSLADALGDDAQPFKDYLRKHIEMFETASHGAASMAHICRSFLMILENAPDKIEVPGDEVKS